MSVTEDPRRERPPAAEDPGRRSWAGGRQTLPDARHVAATSEPQARRHRDPRRDETHPQPDPATLVDPKLQRRAPANDAAARSGRPPEDPRRERVDPRRDDPRREARAARDSEDPRREARVPRTPEEPRRAHADPDPRAARRSGAPAHDHPAPEPRRAPLEPRSVRDGERDADDSRWTGRPQRTVDDARREQLAARLEARAARSSEPAGGVVPGQRYPSEPGRTANARAAVGGGAALSCKVGGLAVEIDPLELTTSGVFVPSPPPLDSEVHVSLAIGNQRFELAGHVVQSSGKERRRPGYGVLFTQLDERTRSQLRDAIEALGAQPKSAPAPAAPALSGSASVAGAAVDPKEHEVLAKLRAELATVEQQPPWTVLGISQGADAAAAREAFFAASKRYHPHVYARYVLPEIKDVVTQLFIAYKRAFTSMTKTGRSPRTAARGVKSGNPPGRSSDPENR